VADRKGITSFAGNAADAICGPSTAVGNKSRKTGKGLEYPGVTRGTHRSHRDSNQPIRTGSGPYPRPRHGRKALPQRYIGYGGLAQLRNRTAGEEDRQQELSGEISRWNR